MSVCVACIMRSFMHWQTGRVVLRCSSAFIFHCIRYTSLTPAVCGGACVFPGSYRIASEHERICKFGIMWRFLCVQRVCVALRVVWSSSLWLFVSFILFHCTYVSGHVAYSGKGATPFLCLLRCHRTSGCQDIVVAAFETKLFFSLNDFFGMWKRGSQ